MIGNVIEWFDFAVYGYFATDIGRQFFPQSSATGVSDRLHLLANQVETMLPQMERLGITTAAEVALGTLVERMDDEIHAESSVIVGRSEIGAWCQI